MDIVKQCEDVWSSAVCETEQLTVTKVIIKLVRSSNLCHSEKKEIFDIIGFPYLFYLLESEKVSQGCPPPSSKSTALSVLATFSTLTEVATSPQLCDMTEELKSILNVGVSSTGWESLVADTLDCIYNMTKHYKSRKRLFESGIISCLVKLYVIDECERSWLLQILKTMAFHCRSETRENDSAAFEFFLLKMTKDCHGDCSDDELSNRKCALTTLCDPLGRLQGDEEWALEFQELLISVLKGKVSKELRDLAIKLASLMVDKCGLFWLGDDTKNSKLFFLVLVRNISDEVRHALEGKTVEDILKDVFVLNACFSIFESIVSAVVEDNSWHFLKQLKTTLQSNYKSIIDFLSMTSSEWNSVRDVPDSALRELTYSCIRVLCAWLEEETHAFQDDVCKVIPFVLSVCYECFLSSQSVDAACSNSQVSRVDLMRLVLPPIDQLIYDDDLRAVLLERGLMDMMFQYMLYQWSVFQKNPSVETNIELCTICKIVLTVVCMDAKVVPESEVFFGILKFLLNIVPLLSTNLENLCLKANFSALGLLITKQYYRKIKSCETSFYRFLSFSIKFLWDSHHVEDGNDSVSFVMVREYRHIWPDIMETWFLGMHALSTLLPLMPWITDFLMESGWPQHIIASLTRVGEKGIEGSVKCAYQAFLCALVRVSRDAVQILNDSEALYVCKKHKLNELEALLHGVISYKGEATNNLMQHMKNKHPSLIHDNQKQWNLSRELSDAENPAPADP